MKKRKIAMSIALAAVLAASPAALAACSGDHYSSVKFDAQDTSYVVTSQGGSAVSYGNYVYFINGTRGYDDTEGTANVWDKAVKGGLYRAELNGSKIALDGVEGINTFVPVADAEGIEFKYTVGEDYFEKPLNIVDVDKIAAKTVGTTGYANGGIFVYDNAVYFASPNNERNSTGTVQATRTDFFMMPLSGGKPTKLYTTSEGVDTSSAPYAFYKYGNSVYLTVKENTDIVSVKINPAKARADKPVKFEVDATSVYFPVRDTYYTGIGTDTPEDFIYFVRAVDDDDKQRAGTVIEAMRPDGSENFVVSMNGNTETIESVRDGVLFYRTTDINGSTVIAYDSLHNALMEYSPSYKKAQDALSADDRNKQISGQFSTAITSSITSTYAFRADRQSNTVYFAGVTSSAINLYSSSASEPMVGTISTTSGTPLFIQNDRLYFSGSSSDFYRVPLFSHMDGYGEAEKLASDTTSAGISCDYAAGYFTYFAKVDQWASGYTYFAKVDGIQGLEPQFVGQRGEEDIPTEEQIENITGGSSGESSD